MNKTALVVGVSHHNTLGLVRSLGRGGLRVVCILVESSLNTSFVGKSKYVDYFIIVKSYGELLSFLKEYASLDYRLPLLTMNDNIAQFIDNHYDELKLFYRISSCSNHQGELSFWMDKIQMLRTAEKNGLSVPKYYPLNCFENKLSSHLEYPMPCIIKPQKSYLASKTSFRICRNKQQLTSAISELSQSQGMLIQELIQPEYEFLIMGLRSTKTGQTFIPGGLHKLRTCKKTMSLGMLAYAYTTGEIPSSIDVDSIVAMMDELNYDGLFSVEFMMTKDKAFFLEVNLRNDGTQFCFQNAGVNLPAMWIEASVNGTRFSNNLKLEKKYYAVEINYLKNIDWKQPITIFKELRNIDKFAVFDKDDSHPFWYFIKEKLS